MEIYGYCIMPSHVHLILGQLDPSGLMRDLKGFTSRKNNNETIQDNPAESRREWMLCICLKEMEKNSNVKKKTVLATISQ
jgi:REP element-mobilizing transposase RayT